MNPKSVIRHLFFILLTLLVISSSAPFMAQETSEQTFECPTGNPTLNVAAGAVGRELELTQQLLDDYMQLCPNVTVNALQPPDLANDRLGFYQSSLGMGSSAVDVYQIDVIWPGILAEHFIDFYEYIDPDSETITQHFRQNIDNNTVNGKLVGMPWFTDAGMLYYRTDLLEKYGIELPTTWDELETAARTIQDGERADGNSQFWGYIWQGNLGEATTISSLEWQASHGGGRIINDQAEVQVNNPETIKAVERAATWIDTISPPTVLGHGPGASLQIWQAGNAAFMRNWPFAYSISNDEAVSVVAGNFDITQLPGETQELRTGVLGGWQLAVSRYSRYPEASVSLVAYMTSIDAQRLRAIEAGLLPTIASLYEEPEVLEAQPFLANMLAIVSNAVPRPSTISGDQYNEVSRLYSNAVTSVLTGEEEAENALEDLEFDLEDLIESTGIGSQPTEQSVETTAEALVAAETSEEATTDVTTEQTEEASTTTETQATPEQQPAEEEESAIDPLIIVGALLIVVVGGFAVYSLANRGKK